MKVLKSIWVRPIRLFLLLAFLCSLGSCNREQQLSVSRIPDDLKNSKLQANGIYPDGWVGEACSLVLQQPRGELMLTVRGMVPRLDKADFRTVVELRVDDTSIVRREIGPGDFQISAPIPTGPARRRVSATFSALQPLPAGDTRNVAARFQ